MGGARHYLAKIAPALKTTPGQLRGMMLAVGLFAAIVFLVIWGAVDGHHVADKTVARDATRSIVAAQKTKAGLTAMHANAVRGLLGAPEAAKEYEQQRAEVTEAVLEAARTITYPGEEEQVRILLNGVRRYEAAIAAAVALSNWDRAEVLNKVSEADGILNNQLLPAADELDRINSVALDTEYGRHKDRGQIWEAGVAAVGIVLVGTLVRIQIYLRRQFRRTCSPLVVLATVLVAAFVLFTLFQLITSRANLKLAKEDAFDSIHTLRKARADGYTALAAGQLRLLDPEKTDVYKERLSKAVDRIARVPEKGGFKEVVADASKLNLTGAKDKARLPEGFSGHLRKELENITFDGEQKAALAALASFGEFVGEISPESRLREGAQVVVLPPSTEAASAALAAKFAQFDANLGEVIRINEDAFDREIKRGKKVLDRCGGPNPWAMAGVFVLTALGLYPRLREYAI
jgi:hypothetical protein